MNNKMVHMVAWLLLVVGGINWLLVGLGGFAGSSWNLVTMLFGMWPQVEWIVYILVGLAAIYEIVTHKNTCKMCSN